MHHGEHDLVARDRHRRGNLALLETADGLVEIRAGPDLRHRLAGFHVRDRHDLHVKGLGHRLRVRRVLLQHALRLVFDLLHHVADALLLPRRGDLRL